MWLPSRGARMQALQAWQPPLTLCCPAQSQGGDLRPRAVHQQVQRSGRGAPGPRHPAQPDCVAVSLLTVAPHGLPSGHQEGQRQHVWLGGRHLCQGGRPHIHACVSLPACSRSERAAVQDIDVVNRAQRGLKAGTVWVNCWVRPSDESSRLPWTPKSRCLASCLSLAGGLSSGPGTQNVYDSAVPFGGYKQSVRASPPAYDGPPQPTPENCHLQGIGRDKGQDALANYTQVRCTCQRQALGGSCGPAARSRACRPLQHPTAGLACRSRPSTSR